MFESRYLAENLPFVDANRTAIWGWSYGGFAAASTLATDKEGVFQCAMSVAPVTNWIYYGIHHLNNTLNDSSSSFAILEQINYVGWILKSQFSY